MNTSHKFDMNNLNNNHPNILDLPDEILIIIFEKLNMVDVFYSLVDVNQRFDRLALDPLCLRDLNITSINSVYDQTSSIDAQVLSRICDRILPRIHQQVHKLTIEEYSMKQILGAGNYPQLHSLSLITCQEEILYQYLTDDSILRDLLTEQITHLDIDIKTTTNECSETVAKIFGLILCLCKRLSVLNFCDMFPARKCLTHVFYLPFKSYMSSTLIKLRISVATLIDCLFLLDGCLDSLSILIIHVSYIFDPIIDIRHKKQLPKLKCLTFTSFNRTYEYDNFIVPLLCGMTNLEELNLSLSIGKFNSTYIDGIQLYEQFLIYMTKLKKFTFNIKTKVTNEGVRIKLPSNKDIQSSFIRREYREVASYVHTTSMNMEGKCHIYSLPYEFDHFINLDNFFPGGMFVKVRYLTMKDKIAFENELFQFISQQFPFLEFLSIFNDRRQNHKQRSSILITFPYLTRLDLKYARTDYAKQFLLEKNAHLPRLSNLRIKYKSLVKITNNFVNDATHFNLCTVTSLDVCETFVYPNNFHEYFPLLQIDSMKENQIYSICSIFQQRLEE